MVLQNISDVAFTINAAAIGMVDFGVAGRKVKA
ncbi:MAG: hypothetical protein ACI8XC_002615 [Gammaproteobacteria bacterium]|jgi:hypothetical protein